MELLMGKGSCVDKVARRTSGAPVQGFAGWLLEMVTQIRHRRRGVNPGRQKQLHVVETLALGHKKHLLLVSCGGERFLIGTGLESVQTIVRVSPEAERGAPAASAATMGVSC